ncbi:MAG: imelysin family protein [Saprospiraceae bacterium]
MYQYSFMRHARNFSCFKLGWMLLAVWSVTACKGPKDEAELFDRGALLNHYARNLIQPAHQRFYDGVLALNNDWETYRLNPTPANLSGLKNRWQTLMGEWRLPSIFSFGPGGEEGLRKSIVEELGTFPVSTAKIEQYIAAGDTTFNNFDRDSRGLFAIEYLIFVRAGELADDLRYQAYMQALIGHLLRESKRIRDAWESYATTFTNNQGTDAGSSVSLLYNEFVRSFESVKNFKLGLPLGLRPGQTKPEPQLVEGYYSGFSLNLLQSHLEAIYHVYAGTQPVANVAGPGFKDYVNSVVGGPELVEATLAQWQKVLNAANAIPADIPLSDLVAQQHPSALALHTELQKHTRFFKSDMSSLLGISITFSSGDGD